MSAFNTTAFRLLKILVIFGASGDLTQRKLVPALYQMRLERRLPPELTIVGVARREWSHDYFRQHMKEGVEEFGGGISSDASSWEKFAAGLFYCPGNIDKPEDYQRLKQFLAELDEKKRHSGQSGVLSFCGTSIFLLRRPSSSAALVCWLIPASNA